MKPIIFFLFSLIVIVSCNLPQRLHQASSTNQKSTVSESKLSKENKELKSDLKEAEDDLEDAEEDLEDAEEELDEIERKLEEEPLSDSERSQLENKRDELKNEVSDLKEDKEALERARDCWRKTRDRVCGSGRNERVENAILATVSGVSDCDDINYCHLEEITSLDLSGDYDPESDPSDCGDPLNDDHTLDLDPDRDLAGLTGLESLDLSGNCFKNLFEEWDETPSFFSSLDNIESIDLRDTGVKKLPADFFDGVLDSLEDNGVLVNERFHYCGSPNPPFFSKLGPSGVTLIRRNRRVSQDDEYCY